MGGRLSPVIYDIFWNYFGVEAEDLWVRRVDCHTHPMSFRSAKCLDAGEILKPSASLLAEERLVHAEGVRVAMEECDWLVIALQFLGQRLDVVIIGGRLRRVRGTNAAKQSKIELLRSDKAMVVAKLKGARERKRALTGKVEGRKSHAELRPEVWQHQEQLFECSLSLGARVC